VTPFEIVIVIISRRRRLYVCLLLGNTPRERVRTVQSTCTLMYVHVQAIQWFAYVPAAS